MRALKILIHSLLSISVLWGCAGPKSISYIDAPEVMAWGNLNGIRVDGQLLPSALPPSRCSATLPMRGRLISSNRQWLISKQ